MFGGSGSRTDQPLRHPGDLVHILAPCYAEAILKERRARKCITIEWNYLASLLASSKPLLVWLQNSDIKPSGGLHLDHLSHDVSKCSPYQDLVFHTWNNSRVNNISWVITMSVYQQIRRLY